MSNILGIVIDADIARSSGFSEHPLSSGSRALLDRVKSGNHTAVMCPTLRAEWKKHRSLYSSRWLASMIAKKRVDFVNLEHTLKDKIESEVDDEKLKSVTTKDCHLVDAALISDKIVVSNDSNARKAFCELSMSLLGELKSIVWFHPIDDREFIKDFLLINDRYVPDGYYLRVIENG